MDVGESIQLGGGGDSGLSQVITLSSRLVVSITSLDKMNFPLRRVILSMLSHTHTHTYM